MRSPTLTARHQNRKSPPRHRGRVANGEAPLDKSSAFEDDELFQMISENAYYRAERRGFQAGEEVADWLAAEREVRSQLASASG